MTRTPRWIFCLLLAVGQLCGQSAPAAARPKIVVAIIVDQFRYDYMQRFRADYHAGFDRLLTQGAFFIDAHLPQSATVTAVGHATFLTGATPSFSGIIANEWYERESGTTVTSVTDRKTFLVGANGTNAGASPRRLLVSTIGDELKMTGSDSRVISVSMKDRAAILPGGHMADGAYWFDLGSETWVTSTYYREALPQWAKAINDARPAHPYREARWLPLDAKPGTAPFCTMVQGTADRYCGNIESAPYGNEILEEFAERAIEAEDLGRHAGTDILAVSFSANDYVGHNFGPDSPAVRDMAIRTDRVIGKLLAAVERRVGAGNMLVVMAADHGVSPMPEANVARHMPGGRLDGKALTQKINDALAERFGPGKWIVAGSVTMPYLDLKLIEKYKLMRAQVERVAAEAARAAPHIARVYTRTELLRGAVQNDDIGRAAMLGFFAPRYSDLLIIPEPYYLFEEPGKAAHGAPYEYDHHIPLVFMGPGIKAGTYKERALLNDVAPTLAAMLGLQPPTSSIGRVLREMLP